MLHQKSMMRLKQPKSRYTELERQTAIVLGAACCANDLTTGRKMYSLKTDVHFVDAASLEKVRADFKSVSYFLFGQDLNGKNHQPIISIAAGLILLAYVED